MSSGGAYTIDETTGEETFIGRTNGHLDGTPPTQIGSAANPLVQLAEYDTRLNKLQQDRMVLVMLNEQEITV